MAFIIAMSNEKGGVAKTTSTLSLGAALAELEHRVLVIDLDPQANLSLALGLESRQGGAQNRDPQDGCEKPRSRPIQLADRNR